VIAVGARDRWALRPLRALAYLLAIVPLPALAALIVIAAAAKARWAVLLALGAPVLAGVLVAAVVAAPLLRRAVVVLGGPPVIGPLPPSHGRAAALGLLSVLLAPLDVVALAGWLVGGPLLLAAPVLVGSDPLALGPWSVEGPGEAWSAAALGLLVLVAGAIAAVALAEAHATLARTFLGAGDLDAQVVELTRSRRRLVDAFDSERRRIERDLHDGAQQQLVNLAMTLDLARIELEREPRAGEAKRLVDAAHEQAARTIADLRALVRGIHPPLLTERGLGQAVRALADASRLETRAVVELDGRLPDAVESAGYFVVSEALANAAKHSGARQVDVTARRRGGQVEIEVRDDGAGGADPADGSGLDGLADRVAALGGTLLLSSPPGGPTVVRATLPVPPDRRRPA
jgi:signal transduction histidine kinase